MLKITLRGVTSFGPDTKTFETDSKINLIYGLNGTGKTTISDFLYYLEENKEQFKDCTLKGIGDEKILVYNQNFIQDNFVNQDKLRGIFTLSKTNKVAEDAIRHATKERDTQREAKEEKQKKQTEYEGDMRDLDDGIKDVTWEIKTEYAGGDRVLEFCLEGLKKKELLFSHIGNEEKPSNKPSITIEELKNKAQALIGTEAQKHTPLKMINLNVRDIEDNSIFSEIIVGNTDSTVADLINTLSNSDWVKKGIDYLPEEISQTVECPFCQQKTITNEVAMNIRAYFDEAYDKKILKIKQLESLYKEVLPEIDGYLNHPFMQERKAKFIDAHNRLNSTLEKNRSKIASKIDQPSQLENLDSTKVKLEEVNNIIAKVNVEIGAHNENLDNVGEEKKAIKNRFWQIMRWDYDTHLTLYHNKKNELQQKINQTKMEIDASDEKIQKQDQEIALQQKNVMNIEEAISNINQGLKELGIEGFVIKKYEENSYRVMREGLKDSQYSTLSEGERMIISFLYFMELCKGKDSEEEMDRKKIVIIDDPVSSLSHIYIFNISQWINRYFFKEDYKQVFVLTHSLYFFHELVRHVRNKGLFRMTKSSSEGSQIHPMEQAEIKNEYESYWQVLIDHDSGKASNALLANCMRNILEHFFSFIMGDPLSKALEKLDKKEEFSPFLRYMNRESHSDSTNLTDYKEIDPQYFKKAFREVFSISGYENHYKTMMGENNDTPA